MFLWKLVRERKIFLSTTVWNVQVYMEYISWFLFHNNMLIIWRSFWYSAFHFHFAGISTLLVVECLYILSISLRITRCSRHILHLAQSHLFTWYKNLWCWAQLISFSFRNVRRERWWLWGLDLMFTSGIHPIFIRLIKYYWHFYLVLQPQMVKSSLLLNTLIFTFAGLFNASLTKWEIFQHNTCIV